MFTELLQTEVWRKRLEAAGYKVVNEAWEAPRTRSQREEQGRQSAPAPLPAAPIF